MTVLNNVGFWILLVGVALLLASIKRTEYTFQLRAAGWLIFVVGTIVFVL